MNGQRDSQGEEGRTVEQGQTVDRPPESASAGPGLPNAQPRFGAVKVSAALLSQAVEAKTYVITNRTTVRDLVAIVLSSYHALCEDTQLFYLNLERAAKRHGPASGSKSTRLDNNCRPLEVQTRYPRGDTRFSLQMDSGASLVTVNDSHISKQANGPISRTAFITKSTTCRELIQMVLRAHKIEDAADKYALYEVDSNSQVARLLGAEQKPLDSRKGRLDRHQTYLEIRPLGHGETDKQVRRTHSLNSLGELGAAGRLHLREAKKSLIPRKKSVKKEGRSQHNAVSKGDNGGLRDPHQDTTMSKLKDSLSKLRQHLDNLQKRRPVSNPADNCEEINNTTTSTENEVKVNELPRSVVSHDNLAQNEAVLVDGLRKSQSTPGDLISRIGRRNSKGFAPIEVIQPVSSPQGASMEQYYESLSQPDIGHHVTLLHHHHNHDANDSGDTSLNESDAGSTSASFRGTNDSAYASDRVSLSSQYRRRRRGSQGASSGQSSPESSNVGVGTRALRKAQSMLELERPFQADKPTRVRSATHAHRAQRARRISGSGEGTDCAPDDPNSTWARRKQYDMNRRAHTADVRRTRSFTNAISRIHHDSERPTSATSEISNTSGRSRMRRALPKVPQTADIEERKRRMSSEVLKRVRSTESLNGKGGSYSQHMVRRDSDSSGAEVPQFLSVTDANHNLYKPKATLLSKSSEFFNGFQTLSHHGGGYDPPKPQLSRQDSSSQEQLQQLIRDLKDAAATRPYEGATVNNPRSGSRSSTCFCPAQCEKHDSDPNYKQLAQWGVLEPTADDLVTYHRGPSNRHSYPQNFTNESPISRQHNGSHTICSPSSRHSNSPSNRQYNNLQNHQNGPYIHHGSAFHASDSSNHNGSDIKVSHPSLFRIMQSCDLFSVVLEKPRQDRDSGEMYDFGIELFESAYSDYDGKEREKRPIFRTPSGRKPIIGRRKGAFMPLKETGTVLSLVAVDVVQENSVARNSGKIQEGDFVIEVNSHNVLEWSLNQVRVEVAKTERTVELVVARPKYSQSQGPDNPEVAQVQKELDIMCLKYASLKQDLEDNMDALAELQLELKARVQRLQDLEHCVQVKDTHIGSLENQMRKRDEDVASWKCEANQRNLELARLKFEAKQREERIVQLRRLLIQQTELMQLQGLAQNGDDLEDFEEHVSAV